MKVKELKTNARVWCWWKSRYLYFTGKVVNGKYRFIDICDAIVDIEEKDIAKLETK